MRRLGAIVGLVAALLCPGAHAAQKQVMTSYSGVLQPIKSTDSASVPALQISGITGSTQCLNVNSSGVAAGTGAPCGGAPGGSSGQLQYNNSGVLGGVTLNVTLSFSGGTLALNLAHANTWTGYLALSGGSSITPAATPATNETGYLGTPENIQNTNYTLAMTDAGGLLYHTSGSAHTYTIPANASVAFPIGTIIVISNEDGAGVVTVAITSDTLRWTTLTGSRLIAADGTVTLIKVTSTLWRMTGDGIS